MIERARIGALVGVFALAACGGGGGEPGDQPAAASEPAYGGMLVVGMEADADVLLPQTSTSAGASDVINHLFAYLMEAAPDLIHHEPMLADSFRFSEDSLSIDFFIHPEAVWHDGEPITAADVVFAMEVCRAPEINFSSIAWLEHITDVEAIDEKTVRFHYDEPYMAEYMVTDANVCHPLPEHILGDVPMADIPNHPFTRAPVGSGPFRFVSWDAGQRIVIEAFPDFHRGRPYLNRVTYRIIPEPTTIATEIRNGAVDLWPRFQSSFYPQFSETPGVEVISKPGRSYTYITYNTNDPIFADARVRKALTYGLDRQAILDAALYGQGAIGTAPIIPVIWAHDPSIEPYPHDPDEARRLLEEAGWTDADGDGIREKDGRPLRFTLSTNAENKVRTDVLQVAQQQWRAIGARVESETFETNTFYDRLMAHDYQAAIAGWVVGIKPDMEPTFKTGEVFNFPDAKNARLDSIMHEAVLARDMESARELWSRAQRIVVDEAYYTFLFEQNDLSVIAERFEGVEMTPYGWDHYLRRWFVPENRQKYDIPLTGETPVAAGSDTTAAAAGR